MINIAIRATYYIFCCRNRNWDSPDLMQFLFFCFCFCFCFNNPISSRICKLPIRSEICNCTFKNTNKVSIIIRTEEPTVYNVLKQSSVTKPPLCLLSQRSPSYSLLLPCFCRFALLRPVFQRYMLLFLVVSGVHLLVGCRP